MGKKRFIESLEEGQQVDDLFMVKSVRLTETRAGKPYLSLVFSDKSGEIGGPAWDNAEALEKFVLPAGLFGYSVLSRPIVISCN